VFVETGTGRAVLQQKAAMLGMTWEKARDYLPSGQPTAKQLSRVTEID
jgi:hypothetical protein